MSQFIGGVPTQIGKGTSYIGNWISDKWNNSNLGKAVNAIPVGDSNVGNVASSAKSYIADKVNDFFSPERSERIADGIRSLTNQINSIGDSVMQKPFVSSGNSAGKVSSSVMSPQAVDYLNADLAKHYGLGAATAYQEALSNTAYQRAVKDMKAAGLNPAAIFGAGKGYTAGGVSYVDSVESNNSGAVGGSGSNDEKLFSNAMYYGLSTAVGLATMASMKKGPIGFYIGQTAAKAVLGVLNELQ